jgi:general secretion pathway protein A
MVPEYFGLKEAAFSITPDPQYLYLSPRHQEALAHLLYGAGEGGGFVLLSGEVGTGKTTICRTFLEQLPEHVDLALILNPALDVPELLHAICDEFGVTVAPGDRSPKVLVDCLNAYLLDAHGRGRRPVLMIDEAQNLAPEVLEQIRLLTNLETAKHKLLQIFLVGQPELHDLLQRRDLRQLAQRITARYHLMPLDAGETDAYIRHRLAVAGTQRHLFSAAAVRRVHRLTGGVPRLINILCERALLGAYAGQTHQVDRGIVGRAWRELNGGPPRRSHRRLLPVAAVGLALALGGGWLAHVGKGPDSRPAPEPQAPVPPVSAVDRDLLPGAGVARTTQAEEQDGGAPDAAPSALLAPVAPAVAAVDSVDPVLEPALAQALLFRQWALTPPAAIAADPCPQARELGLRCKAGRGDWDNLRGYDRPTLIPLARADGGSGTALVLGLGRERALLAHRDGSVTLPLVELQGRWNGEYLFFWRPAPGDHDLIGPRSTQPAQRWLRQALAEVPGLDLGPDLSRGTGYEPELRAALRTFQRAQGLDADGIAGPETLIRLNSAAGLPDIPHLKSVF